MQILKRYACRLDRLDEETLYSCGVPFYELWHLQSWLGRLSLQMGYVGSKQAESPWWSGSIYRQAGQNNNVL